MPMPRTRRITKKRLNQVVRWLREEFPFRGCVVVSFDHTCNTEHGACISLGNSSYVIRIHPQSPVKIETLQHEWAHLGVGRRSHNKAWGERYQQICQKWNDHGGAEESRSF